MEGFSYVDIFDTKGIEYLIVIGFLLLIIPVWIAFNKPVRTHSLLMKSMNGLSAQLLKMPKGLFYSKNHTWTFMEKTGAAKIGLDDLLLHITGGVSVDFLAKEGDHVNKGDQIATLLSEDRSLKITSPISGEIEDFNKSLRGAEGAINMDPYGRGWICKVKPENWKSEVSNYKIENEAEEWAENELLRCKDFLASVTQNSESHGELVLQEGGEISDFPLADLPGEVWQKFQLEFLD